MEVKADENVVVPWESLVHIPIKVPLGLFNLLPYMLTKFDSKNSFLDDFKAMLV